MSLLYPDNACLDRIRELLNDGRPLDALALTDGLQPVDRWQHGGALAAYYGARLLSWLGSHHRSLALVRVARKRYPDSPELYLRGHGLVARTQGMLAAWQYLRNTAAQPPMEDRHRFFLLNLLADHYADWSDFATAHSLLKEAEQLKPKSDRTLVTRAYVLNKADRRQEAVEHLTEAISIRPGNATAPRMLADQLRAQGRDEEALAVLESAAQRVQDFDVVLAMANWHSERGNHARALEIAADFERLQPLADRGYHRWIAGWRAFRHYLSGNTEAALACAEKSPRCFISEIAERLKSGEKGRRIQLPVPFVRQDRRTCAPATLAAISRFWGDEADHIEIADEICYDGTPAHQERRWAEERGYHVREFRVDAATTRALLDRGVPFTLTTVQPSSAHLQGVIGYDSTSDTILVREPGWADCEEYRMAILDDYAFSGPRGMLLAPKEKAAELADVPLPDAELYDELHRLQLALHANDRAEAAARLDALRAASPGHLLVHMGERLLARWDGNPHAQLAATEALLEKFPDQPALSYSKLLLLRSTAGRSEQISFARKLIATKKAPPEVSRMLADLLDDDARDWPQAWAAWAKAGRACPYDASTLTSLGDFYWDQLRRDEATQLYRLAACLEILNESCSRTYFNAARWIGPDAQAQCLTFLRQRVENHGRLSGHPARTLAWALEGIHRGGEALQMLDDALALRPNDGDLMLFAAESFRNAGHAERAAALLAGSEKLVRAPDWLRRAAFDAISCADLPLAMEYYRRALELEPTARDLHSSLADLLAGTSGIDSAIEHLEQACAKFPGNAGLHSLLCEWLGEHLQRRAEVLRHMLEIDPADAWAKRELAIDLKRQDRHAEAISTAREALAIAPNASSSHGILADMLHAAGQLDEARSHLKKALAIDIDYVWGISELVSLAHTTQEKRDCLQWVLGELEKQVTNGEGLRRWWTEAWPILEPDEILRTLEKVKSIRPDLWLAWSTLAMHLLDMGRSDEALAVAMEETQRFPLLPRVWYDLATVHQRRADIAGQQESIRQALAINPRWDWAVQRMAGICETLGEMSQARELLEAHTRAHPLDTGVLLDLVNLLLKADDNEAAKQAARRAVSLAPLSRKAWDTLARCSRGNLEEETALLDEVCRQTLTHPQSFPAWDCRSAVTARLKDFHAEISVLDEALERLPKSWDLLDRKAMLLAELGDYDAALACCATEGTPPDEAHYRRARRADILSRQGRLDQAIAEMEALVADRPDYIWAVRRLVEWHDHRADHQAILKWATQQARLAPDDAVAFGFQADALLHLGDKEAAEQRLRTAVALDPGYIWAGRTLIALELRRKDVEAAERTVARVRGRVAMHYIAETFRAEGFAERAAQFCASAVELDSADWRNHKALSDAEWELGHKEKSIAAGLESCLRSPEDADLSTKLAARAKDAGSGPQIADKIRAWVAESPDKPERHHLLCRFFANLGDPAARLAALDTAISHVADPVEFADLKAELLTNQRRYTDAIAVCNEHDTGAEPNAIFRRRHAWIEAQRGNRTKAIQLMEEALKLDETSVFGLQKICDWLEHDERPQAAVGYAEKLIRAAPTDAVSFGFLASALLRCKRESDAEPHLMRAFRMWNGYQWAADRLFEIQLNHQDFPAAAVTLRMLQEHLPGVENLVKEVQLAAARKDMDAAIDAWKRLAVQEKATTAQLETAETALTKSGKAARHAMSLPELLKSAPTNDFLAYWTGFQCRCGKTKVWRKLQISEAPESARMAAWVVYLRIAGEKLETPQSARFSSWKSQSLKAIRRNSAFLQKHTELWGWVAWLLLAAHRYSEGRKWVADWKERPTLEMWMSVNIADLLDGKRTIGRSAEVRQWVLENLPPDHGASFHRVSLALFDAVKGRITSARQHLANIREEDFSFSGSPAELRFTARMAKLMADLGDTATPMKTRRQAAATAFRAAMKELGGEKPPVRTLRTLFLPALRLAGMSKLSWMLLGRMIT